MNRGFYTPCNVYTRRQSSDVFHNDPFKVQSYNFHYAERPAYTVQHYQRPPPKKPAPPPFKTFYYNAKFHRNQESLTAAPPTSSFAETRRRQFLQDFNRVSTPVRTDIGTGFRSCERQREGSQARQPVTCIPPAVATNMPILRTCCNREDYKTMRRGQSVTAINTSLSRTESRSPSLSTFSFKQPERNQSQSTFKLSPRRSASSCSGCAININIRGMDSKTDMDKSLRIKIQTDTCLHNNTDKHRIQTNHGRGLKTCTTGCRSSETFVIDKRLSKFSMANVHVTNGTRKPSCEQDALLAKRLQLQSERERLEKMRQQELHKEQESARQREEKRERLRQLERQRDHERLLELEAERENQRIRELEHNAHRKREIERRHQEKLRQVRQQRMLMRAMSMPSSITPPVVMTSHLYRPASTDRLPGMVPCNVRQSTVNSRSERLQKCTQNLTTLQCPKSKLPRPQQESTLERRSSGTSNYNVSVPESGSNISMRQLSATRLNEPKLLNLHVNGVPVTSNLPIHARINNMPIRITTSQPADEHLQFSVNRVRVANALPIAGQERRSNRSHSRSSSRSGLEEPSTIPCNVSINVYADNPRTMRL